MSFRERRAPVCHYRKRGFSDVSERNHTSSKPLPQKGFLQAAIHAKNLPRRLAEGIGAE
jgi:hypothetical protein